MNEGASFEVFVFFVGKGSLLSSNPLVGKFLNLSLGHFSLLRFEGKSLNEIKVGITGECAKNPEEWLFVLVVGLGRDVEVLQIAFSMEGDLAGLDFSVFLINFVSDKDDRNVVTDSGEIFVPLGDVFVGDSGGNIEHHDGGMCSNVVSFTESSQFFLSCSIPECESDGSVVGVESDGANFDSLSGDVLLFKLSGDMSLDEGGLAYTSISDEDNLELSYNFRRLHVNYCNSQKLMPHIYHLKCSNNL